MEIELVKTTTSDGLQLDAALQLPRESTPPAVGVDAFCLVHGTGGNFYNSSLLGDLAERLLKLGCAVLRVNTRGHDGISTTVTAQGGVRLGAAYETVDDCRHDLHAWMDWLRQRYGQRIGLMGHSMGAIKALYAVAHEPLQTPVVLVAISPPRLSYTAFCRSSQARQFLQTYTRAEQLVSSAESGTLMEVQIPLPYVITAAGYVEKYGPEEQYNFLRYLAAVRCLTLILLGSKELENNMAFQGLPQEIEAHTKRSDFLRMEIIAGADHFYTGLRLELADRVEQWLRSLPLL